MKSIKVLSLTAALMTAGMINATIYLTKDGNVVASYEDDMVDAISFEDPTVYDIQEESILMHQIYYGEAFADRGYNYVLIMSDADYDNRGQFPMTSTNFIMRLNAPVPEDPSAPLLPAGTYKLNLDNNLTNSILGGELSYCRQNLNTYYFTSATLNISYDITANKVIATLIAEDAEGNKIKTNYAGGQIYLEKNTVEWYNEDVYMTGGTLTATYLKYESGFDNKCNMNIMIAENGYDEGGWMKTPGNLITFVGNVELDAKGHFKPATWEIMDGDVAEPNKLLAGRIANLMGAPFPVNTNVAHYYDDKNIEIGLVKSGSASISETSDGVYKLTYDFLTHKGKKLQGVYEGKIEIQGLPKADTFTLTEDYVLNLENAQGTFNEWSNNECQIDLHFFNANYQYFNDRLALKLISKNGTLVPGIYKVINDATCVGTITPGVCTPNFKTDSFFIHYDPQTNDELIGAGIGAGQIEIIDNANGTWTINIDLRDNTKEAHKITGTWTGEVVIK